MFYRSAGSRIEHLVYELDTRRTLCGIPTNRGAKYTAADNHADSIVRPLCAKCRKIKEGK